MNSLEQFHNKIKGILDLYEEEKLFQAADELDDLHNSLNQHKDSDLVQKIKLEMDNNKTIQKMIKEEKLAKKLLNAMESSDGWTESVDRDRVQVYYKEESTTVHSLKIVGVLDSPMLNVLTVFYESDLYKSWTPSMKSSQVLMQEKKYRYLCHYGFSLPWPLHDRDVIAYGYGVDLSDRILVVVRSVNDDEHDQYPVEIPEPGDDARMDIYYAGILITPLNDSQTRVTLTANVDPKLDYVPAWFLNMVLQQMSYFVISTLRNVTANIMDDEVYAQRVREKPHIYEDIKSRMVKHAGEVEEGNDVDVD
ncbi:PCTP-like protein [Acrasis kona]|uniref:PCTP-like protein n=1 Tax=Acrasis kona TaxID=1008807 RepID=A0AAW2ZG47_9EUKA